MDTESAPQTTQVGSRIDSWVRAHETELIGLRRDLHAHPELGYVETRTTAVLLDRLTAVGLTPRVLARGTGVVCDIGPAGRPAESEVRTVVLRADIDALPLFDVKDVDYRSRTEGIAHACGHDAHTAILVGAAACLAELAAAGDLPGRVRCIFQPAEEQVPGGALEVIREGLLADAIAAFALHCDPSLPVGQVGLRTGAITAACDAVSVTLRGPGGHTARPHLTVDLVDALGRIITETPGLLSRQMDPRAGLSLVWGAVGAGVAANTIPEVGTLRGTVRLLDRTAWDEAEKSIRRLITDLAAAVGAQVEIDYVRGVPPVVNAEAAIEVIRSAVLDALGTAGAAGTEQSLGGEDFSWYADHLPIALARLGTHGGGPSLDLHQGSFDIDERAIGIGVSVLTRTALLALA